MAKMTIKDVTYEGTPEELREIVRTFEEAVDEEGETAETLTFEGAEYALVSRKARTGDVVVFTKNKYSCLTNGEPYEVVDGIRTGYAVHDDDDGSRASLYQDYNGRTEDATLVYEKVAEEVYPENGDIVRVIGGSALDVYNIGDIGVVTYADKSNIPQIEVSGITGEYFATVELVARAEDRVDTK